MSMYTERALVLSCLRTPLPLLHVTTTVQWPWVAVLIAQYCIIVMRHAGGKGMEPRSGKGQAHTYVLAFTQKLVRTVYSTTSTHRAQTCRQAYYVRTYTQRHLLIQKAALYTLSTRAVWVGEEIHSGTLDGKLFICSQHPSFTFWLTMQNELHRVDSHTVLHISILTLPEQNLEWK